MAPNLLQMVFVQFGRHRPAARRVAQAGRNLQAVASKWSHRRQSKSGIWAWHAFASILLAISFGIMLVVVKHALFDATPALTNELNSNYIAARRFSIPPCLQRQVSLN